MLRVCRKGQSQGLPADNTCTEGGEAVGALCVGSTLWLYSICDMPHSPSVGYAGNAGLLGVEGLRGSQGEETLKTQLECVCAIADI